MQTFKKRTLHFLKDLVSDYDFLLSKGSVDSFGNLSIKSMAVEVYRIFSNMGADYLLSFFVIKFPYQL